jgi:hypothetical protein
VVEAVRAAREGAAQSQVHGLKQLKYTGDVRVRGTLREVLRRHGSMMHEEVLLPFIRTGTGSKTRGEP